MFIPPIPILKKIQHFGKCPGCELLNDVDAKTCKHCQRVFTKPDQIQISEYVLEQKKKGQKFGVYFVVIFIILVLMFSQT